LTAVTSAVKTAAKRQRPSRQQQRRRRHVGPTVTAAFRHTPVYTARNN